MTNAPDTCPTCGAARPDAFCGTCGERRLEPDAWTARRFAREAFAGLTSVDGRLWRSLRWLVFRPGAMTAARLRGERVRLLGPVQLFLVANLFAVLVGPLLGHPSLAAEDGRGAVGFFSGWIESAASARGMRGTEFEAAVVDEAARLSRLLFIVLIPIQALFGWLLHPLARRPAGVHLVLATSFLAFYVAAVDTLIGAGHEALAHELRVLGWQGVDRIANATRFLLPLAVCAWWLARADRRVYASSAGIAAIKGAAGSALFLTAGVAGYKSALVVAAVVSLG